MGTIAEASTNLMDVMVLYVLLTSVSSSPLRGWRTVTSSNVLGLAQMSRGIRPTFSVTHLFKSMIPIGSYNNRQL